MALFFFLGGCGGGRSLFGAVLLVFLSFLPCHLQVQSAFFLSFVKHAGEQETSSFFVTGTMPVFFPRLDARNTDTPVSFPVSLCDSSPPFLEKAKQNVLSKTAGSPPFPSFFFCNGMENRLDQMSTTRRRHSFPVLLCICTVGFPPFFFFSRNVW